MAIEYGIKMRFGTILWRSNREVAEADMKRDPGLALIAREVSEPYVVSIRD